MLESCIQKAIVEYLDFLGIYYFSVNNEMAGGGKKAVARMAHFRKMGLRAGASDLVLVLYDQVIFIEVKNATGRLSKHQKLFKEEVEERGHRYEVARSVEDLDKILGHRINTNH